jgi:hypothetical protein
MKNKIKVKFLKQVSNRLKKIKFWQSEVKNKIKVKFLKQVSNRYTPGT